MVELITVIVILGIIAAIAAPRFFQLNVFESSGFYNQAISTLRVAQKMAIAQHAYVCVGFGTSSITLTTGSTAACGTNLISPTGQSPYSVSSSNAAFSAVPAGFNFDSLGQPSFSGTPLTITVSGYATPITVEVETGYVH